MEPFDSYKLYQALKLHFNSDTYDAVKYNFKTNVKPQAYLKRNDKYQFAKAARDYPKRDDLVLYYVANFICGEEWVGSMSEEHLTYWKKYTESMRYRFSQDLDKLKELGGKWFDKALTVEEGLPPIIEMYMTGDIHLLTVVIIDKLTGFMKIANKKLASNFVWPDKYRLITKTGPFLQIDKKVYKGLIVDSA